MCFWVKFYNSDTYLNRAQNLKADSTAMVLKHMCHSLYVQTKQPTLSNHSVFCLTGPLTPGQVVLQK